MRFFTGWLLHYAFVLKGCDVACSAGLGCNVARVMKVAFRAFRVFAFYARACAFSV
ncbi:hypothetical protein HMPREF3192_00244 [Atopobium deltae]|uniref:Uncharacterized protein n=1 Tax=Atopobium deltae TaxID=1393034 RepID=A0A133XWS2_9ACTN|nr:hypothetical protein HMPREF3192_00244 [Atopobium deltae]